MAKLFDLKSWFLKSKDAPVQSEELMSALLAVSAIESQVSSQLLGLPAANRFNAFGQKVRALPADHISLERGAGLALTGARTAVCISPETAVQQAAVLSDLVRRKISLLIYVDLSSQQSNGDLWAVLADSGAVVLNAGSVQEIINLSLFGRKLTETALHPVVLAADLSRQDFASMPEMDKIVEWLTSPGKQIETASEGQRLLLGETRETLIKWIDPERPAATGLRIPEEYSWRGRASSDLFFTANIEAMIASIQQAFDQLFGGNLLFVQQTGDRNASCAVVTVSSAAAAAREAIATVGTRKFSLVRFSLLAPKPADIPAIGNKPVVIETVRHSGSSRGWIASSLIGTNDCTCGFTGSTLPTAGQVAALLEKSGQSGSWHLATTPELSLSTLPHRQAIEQEILTSVPTTLQSILPENRNTDASKATLTLLVCGPASSINCTSLNTLLQNAGGTARTSACRTGVKPGINACTIRVGDDDSFPAVRGSASDFALLTLSPAIVESEILDLVKEGGTVLLTAANGGEKAETLLPASWRHKAKARSIRFAVSRSDLLQVAKTLISGAQPVTDDLADHPGTRPEDVSQLIRSNQNNSGGYDSLSRFHGEQVRPLLTDGSPKIPDPVIGLGASAPNSAALAPVGHHFSGIPVLDPVKCTGCTDCLVSCPDSAIAATVVGVQEWLDTAADLAGNEGIVAGALRRGHKQIATKLRSGFSSQDTAVDQKMLQTAYNAVADKLLRNADDREEMDRLFAETTKQATALTPIRTKLFFDEAEAIESGKGSLFFLAFNPDLCRNCGLCYATCPDFALSIVSRSEAAAQSTADWKQLEQLPDTPSAVLERVRNSKDSGPLAGASLSRFFAFARTGGGTGKSGSGARLSLRLATMELEYHRQSAQSKLADALLAQIAPVKEKLTSLLTGSLAEIDMQALVKALDQHDGDKSGLEQLARTLENKGTSLQYDRHTVRQFAGILEDLLDNHHALVEGVTGLGRARYAMIVADGDIADWALQFPYNAQYAPVSGGTPNDTLALATGVSEGLVESHLEVVRSLRRAELLLDPVGDMRGAFEEIANLSWSDLNADERGAAPSVLVVGDHELFATGSAAALEQIMQSELPIKLLSLAPLDLTTDKRQTSSLISICDDAVIASSSLGELNQLGEALRTGFADARPAVLSVHSPEPDRDGFAPSSTLMRARHAVRCSLVPLFVYDPALGTTLQSRIKVSGYAAPDMDPARWAVNAPRYAEYFESIGDTTGYTDAILMITAEEEQNGKKAKTVHPDGMTVAVDNSLVQILRKRVRATIALHDLFALPEPVPAPVAEPKEAPASTPVAAQPSAEQLAEVLRERLYALASGPGTTGNS